MLMKAYVFVLLMGIFTIALLPTTASAQAYCTQDNPNCCPEPLLPLCGIINAGYNVVEYRGLNVFELEKDVATALDWKVLEGTFLCPPDDLDCNPCLVCDDQFDHIVWQGIQLQEYRNIQILEQGLQIQQSLVITQVLAVGAIIAVGVGIVFGLKRC